MAPFGVDSVIVEPGPFATGLFAQAPRPLTDPAEHRRGLVFGLLAYGAWGVIPIYWRLLRHVNAVEILGHRTVWGLVAFGVMSAALGAGPAVRAALRQPRTLAALALSGVVLLLNWGVFIYAVATDHLLQVSLGYFLNPLLNVVLGMVFLGERLRPLQWASVLLATVGVVAVALQVGGVPWISLVLGVSFAFYGLIRKVVPVDALAGSTVETAILAPFGAAYLLWLAASGQGELGHADLRTHLLLSFAGIVTALPLVWFTSAARRLPLSTVGFLQYLAPTGQFLTAVLLFNEPFSVGQLCAFGFIWAGLAVFTVDLVRRTRRR